MDEQTIPGGPLAEAPGSQTSAPDDAAMPTTSFICGRGRVGKTVVGNAIIQYCRTRGATLEVWNGDRQNLTHNLSLFHTDSLAPATDDPEEKRIWLEANLARQIDARFDAILDVAGGDPMVRTLARDIHLVKSMERRGLRSVAWHVLGPELADLDYLRSSMESGMFMPQATIIVLNEGLVTSGRAVIPAFSEVFNHHVVKGAVRAGAKVVYFPRLICMSAVTEQCLTFDEAKKGTVKPGFQGLSFTDEVRVEVFWDEDVPAFFSKIPPSWLPRMPGGER